MLKTAVCCQYGCRTSKARRVLPSWVEAVTTMDQMGAASCSVPIWRQHWVCWNRISSMHLLASPFFAHTCQLNFTFFRVPLDTGFIRVAAHLRSVEGRVRPPPDVEEAPVERDLEQALPQALQVLAGGGHPRRGVLEGDVHQALLRLLVRERLDVGLCVRHQLKPVPHTATLRRAGCNSLAPLVITHPATAAGTVMQKGALLQMCRTDSAGDHSKSTVAYRGTGRAGDVSRH